MSQKLDILCLFMVRGSTLWFHEVEKYISATQTITFTYKSKTDGMRKAAAFNADHIAGISKCPVE